MTDQTPEAVTFTARPSASDVVWTTVALARASTSGMVVGGFLLTLGVVSFLQYPDFTAGFPILFGLLILSGLFVAPFSLYAINRRRDLVLGKLEVAADPEGLSLTSPTATGRQSWATYRRARETPWAFLLDTGAGASAMIAKRGVSEEEQRQFRALLGRIGLLQRRGTMLTQGSWLLVGIGIALAFMFLLPVVLSPES